jgi:hypothetical protein
MKRLVVMQGDMPFHIKQGKILLIIPFNNAIVKQILYKTNLTEMSADI